MSDFLDGYGVNDERRERRTKRIVIIVVVVLILGTVLYYSFRNWREESRYKEFVQFLQKQDYNGAYRLWGCDPANPCRDYKLEKFMEDWGPKSPHADLSKIQKPRTLNCDSGIIKVMEFSADDQVSIWIDKQDQIISFSPWGDSCRQPIVKGQ